MAIGKKAFSKYLKDAVNLTLKDAHEKNDNGELDWITTLARKGVYENWKSMTPDKFLEQYLWCVGSIQKTYTRHDKYFPAQMALFRQCDATKIAEEAEAIRTEWIENKRDLNSRMVDAVILTACDVAQDWKAFKGSYLLLPANPESESIDDWWDAFYALDSLPMVGWAIAWYLIRNLYGAPFFKPDLHINAIVKHFFGAGELTRMSEAVREIWPEACRDSRFEKLHLGIVDYMLWWYRRSTNKPPDKP